MQDCGVLKSRHHRPKWWRGGQGDTGRGEDRSLLNEAAKRWNVLRNIG